VRARAAPRVRILGPADLGTRRTHRAGCTQKPVARDDLLAEPQREQQLGEARDKARDASLTGRARMCDAGPVDGRIRRHDFLHPGWRGCAVPVRTPRRRTAAAAAAGPGDERHRPRQHVEALAALDRASDQPCGLVGAVRNGIRRDSSPSSASRHSRGRSSRRRRRCRRARAEGSRDTRSPRPSRPNTRRRPAGHGSRRRWRSDERPAPRRPHRRHEGLERVDDAEDVGVEDGAERGQVFGVLGERAARHAGIGDHDVGRTEPGEKSAAARASASASRTSPS